MMRNHLKYSNKRKNVRVLKVSGNHGRVHSDWELKTIGGGLLARERSAGEGRGNAICIGNCYYSIPTEEERTDLFFAYR